jgi:NAD(P)-dependent dehydrogenase (short-subunit alcohol dehydrogenase family)
MLCANLPSLEAKPEEIANPALFLASNQSSFITGGAVPIDGELLPRFEHILLIDPGKN